ncbi:methyl-accepting chemotaxis protein [Rhodothermus marinus]|uniref:methyl-accepting chemotaxis protein n=1 Tax=Rhodothermus marinus TaxID=29549 RepID=UPI000A9CFB7D|nr:methyl-accepting chemotaxis protein [Rhodothermus marinus]
MEVAEKETKPSTAALPSEVAETFHALQQVITRAAIGAARTAQRLERIGQQFAEARAGVEASARAMQQIRQRVEAVAESARSTADVAHQVARLTEEGRQQSDASQEAVKHLEQQVVAVMERLERLVAQVQGITQISDVIDRIAWKTKLLAFNAGIEAARAGHEGQGFSVLANEIKSLSEDTALQTRQIRALINDLVKELQPVEEAIRQSQEPYDGRAIRSAGGGPAAHSRAGRPGRAAHGSGRYDGGCAIAGCRSRRHDTAAGAGRRGARR